MFLSGAGSQPVQKEQTNGKPPLTTEGHSVPKSMKLAVKSKGKAKNDKC